MDVKSTVKLFLLWILFILVCVLSIIIMLVYVFTSHKNAKNMVYSYDQMANATLAGDKDEKISSRSYREESNGSLKWHLIRILIDAIFFFEPEHCKKSYYNEVLEAEKYLIKSNRK